MVRERRPPGTPRGGEVAPEGSNDTAAALPDDGGIPPEVEVCLPAGTAETWRKVAPVVPASARLAGGTGLTVHLQHRISGDLDFMLSEDEDLDELVAALDRIGMLHVERHDEGTLNCHLDQTKLQFLRTAGQVEQRQPSVVGGLEIMSVEDITAMKLRAVEGRAELRDYFDLVEIDRRVVPMEEGLALFARRYGTPENIPHLIRALGFLDDIAPDPQLPVDKGEIERFWVRRQPALSKAAGRYF